MRCENPFAIKVDSIDQAIFITENTEDFAEGAEDNRPLRISATNSASSAVNFLIGTKEFQSEIVIAADYLFIGFGPGTHYIISIELATVTG